MSAVTTPTGEGSTPVSFLSLIDTSINWLKIKDFAKKHFETIIGLIFAALTVAIAPIPFLIGVPIGAAARFGIDKYKGKKQSNVDSLVNVNSLVNESEKTEKAYEGRLEQIPVDSSFMLMEPVREETKEETKEQETKEEKNKHRLLGYQVMANVGTFFLPAILSYTCAFGGGVNVGYLLCREFNNLREQRAAQG